MRTPRRARSNAAALQAVRCHAAGGRSSRQRTHTAPLLDVGRRGLPTRPCRSGEDVYRVWLRVLNPGAETERATWLIGSPVGQTWSLMTTTDTFARRFLDETAGILGTIDASSIGEAARVIRETRRRGGRLFFCGSGGGAGHSSHAACDFRKLAGFEAYCVSDNVSELTARVNDDGWDSSYANWLEGSRVNGNDCLVVFSVGGGDEERGVSANLVNA